MILDVTGTILIPGNGGRECPGNGEYGECCCDECDYFLCCFEDTQEQRCTDCEDHSCPHAGIKSLDKTAKTSHTVSKQKSGHLLP